MLAVYVIMSLQRKIDSQREWNAEQKQTILAIFFCNQSFGWYKSYLDLYHLRD